MDKKATSELEKALIHIWQEVLHQKSVSVEEKIFYTPHIASQTDEALLGATMDIIHKMKQILLDALPSPNGVRLIKSSNMVSPRHAWCQNLRL